MLICNFYREIAIEAGLMQALYFLFVSVVKTGNFAVVINRVPSIQSEDRTQTKWYKCENFGKISQSISPCLRDRSLNSEQIAINIWNCCAICRLRKVDTCVHRSTFSCCSNRDNRPAYSNYIS